MAIDRRRDIGPGRGRFHRGPVRGRPSGHGWSSPGEDTWSWLGIDPENMSPRAQAVTGIVVGGGILLAAALLILFTQFWWLIFVFGWWIFPALGMFARGVGGLVDSSPEKKKLPENDREGELLRILRERGEITPAQAAMETSLSVREADEMLKGLAEGGHLEVRVRGGGLFYSLWEYDRESLEEPEET